MNIMARKINYKNCWIFILCVLIVLAIGYFDYFTGELGFFIFYFIPIILLSWHLGRWYGVAMSIASSLCWFASDYFCNVRYSNFAVAVWDTLVIRGGAFIIAAVAVAKLHDSLEKQSKLDKELMTALGHLKQLKEIAPICANCRSRKDCNCYLDQVEDYIKTNSREKPDAAACPECLGKNFPELLEKLK
ncbi:MAG TPA: hypothetical protein DCZ94_04780 [Lentisphaeria bacterium]|nr:MAG: hypothetical protein A2X48_19995 [Lentisphaerae bacterium GWF2_49_21]HBC86251.1 hypothetical protein [Lentisphaeria bacterium]